MLWALFTLGFEWEAYEFFTFLLETVSTGPLQIMYGIGGERDLPEQTLDHLSCYEGARPVRVGNGAWDQKQHDAWGMLLDSVAIHSRRLGQQLPKAAWELIARLVDSAATAWQEPDRGIWEVRGEPKHFTASKVLCWVASTVERGWPTSAATTNARTGGAAWPTRFTRTSASAGWTSVAYSCSTMRLTPWTPRRCSSR
jgi:alpha,alpha-trehalase